MTTKYIIIADGKSKRWNAEIPKHLIEFSGEPLLQRTVRMIGDQDIVITSHNPLYNFAPRYEPIGNECEIDRFLSCEPIWNNSGVTVFIYGDVYFDDIAMDKIKNTNIGPIAFFGRRGKNQVKKYGEIFAVAVKNHEVFKRACHIVRGKELNGKSRGLGWNVWRELGKRGFVELVGSIAEDFDKVEDLEAFRKTYELS